MAVDKFCIDGTNKKIRQYCAALEIQPYPSINVWVSCFIRFRFCSHSPQWDFCPCKYAALHNAGGFGKWLQTFGRKYNLQTISESKSTVSFSKSSSKCCQHHYRPNPAFPDSTRHLQLFFSPTSGRKKLLQFLIMMKLLLNAPACKKVQFPM